MRGAQQKGKQPIIDLNTEKEKEKNLKLQNAHKKFKTLFGGDDEEEDEEIETGKISINTQSLNDKLNQIMSDKKKPEIIKFEKKIEKLKNLKKRKKIKTNKKRYKKKYKTSKK